MRILHICAGLPGCGKTTFCRQKPNTIDADSMAVSDFGRVRSKELVYDLICSALDYKDRKRDVYLDGLFLVENDVIEFLNYMKENTLSQIPIDQIVIEFWDIDRKTCLLNDQGRTSRLRQSRSLIEQAQVSMDLDKIKPFFPEFQFSICHHETQPAPSYVIAANCCGLKVEQGHFLRSEKWVTGGCCGSYLGTMSPLSADEPPSGFQELQHLLEELMPNLSFRTFNKIMEEAVSIKTDSAHDYYGGITEYAYYEADLRTVFEILEDPELIKEQNLLMISSLIRDLIPDEFLENTESSFSAELADSDRDFMTLKIKKI